MQVGDIHYCPRCGNKLVSKFRMGRERPVCPNCDWIFFPDPKVAVAVLVEQDDKVLLARRENSPQRGKWSLPAGFVDAGEDPARAAERECLEETNLRVQVTELLDVLAGREHPNGADIFIIYRAEVISGELLAGDDADQVGFFDRRALPTLAFQTTEGVLQRC
jgi:8-oxo-dGTP diphosphatase